MRASVTIPLRPTVDAVFVVFFAPTGDEPAAAGALRPLVTEWREQHLTDPLRAAVANLQDRGVASLRVGRVADLPRPPVELLRYMGLGELEERILGAATHAVVVGCPDLNVAPRIGLWAALATALAVADQLDGIVFDPEALRIVRQDAATGWFTAEGTIAVAQHIMVPFSVGDGEGPGWMTTRGLGKFGLPDIELRDVPPNLDRLTVLMNAVAQVLVEAALGRLAATEAEAVSIELPPELDIDGAAAARAHAAAPPADGSNATVCRVGLRFDPGDRKPAAPMIRLLAPEGQPDMGVWLNRVAETLFGSPGDIRMVETASDRMLDAHNRAVSELPYARQRFAGGLREGEVLYVKQGFDTRTGAREYLWLVVTGWSGSRVRGLVANEPRDVPSLRAGQTVTVDEAGLFDWMILMPGDRTEGGYTATVTLEEGRE